MKKTITAFWFMLFAFYGYTQKLDAAKIPGRVKDAFQKAHPGAAPSWEREDGNYEANFKEGGQVMSCVIDRQGTILETEVIIPDGQLPVTAATYMNKHYKGKKWKEVARIVKASGEVNYEVNVGVDVLFDANGNHIDRK